MSPLSATFSAMSESEQYVYLNMSHRWLNPIERPQFYDLGAISDIA